MLMCFPRAKPAALAGADCVQRLQRFMWPWQDSTKSAFWWPDGGP